MQTPIASPQNLLGYSTINTPSGWAKPNDIVNQPLSWGLFLAVTVPFGLASLVLVWGFLWIYYRPKLREVDAIPHTTPSPIGLYHIIVIVRCLSECVRSAHLVSPHTGDVPCHHRDVGARGADSVIQW